MNIVITKSEYDYLKDIENKYVLLTTALIKESKINDIDCIKKEEPLLFDNRTLNKLMEYLEEYEYRRKLEDKNE